VHVNLIAVVIENGNGDSNAFLDRQALARFGNALGRQPCTVPMTRMPFL